MVHKTVGEINDKQSDIVIDEFTDYIDGEFSERPRLLLAPLRSSGSEIARFYEDSLTARGFEYKRFDLTKENVDRTGTYRKIDNPLRSAPNLTEFDPEVLVLLDDLLHKGRHMRGMIKWGSDVMELFDFNMIAPIVHVDLGATVPFSYRKPFMNDDFKKTDFTDLETYISDTSTILNRKLRSRGHMPLLPDYIPREVREHDPKRNGNGEVDGDSFQSLTERVKTLEEELGIREPREFEIVGLNQE